MKPINIRIDTEDSTERNDVKCEFSQNELEILNHFSRYVKNLISIDIIQQGFNANLKISVNKNQGSTYSVDIPNDSLLIPLLHRLRPFILENEDTNYYKISSVVSKYITDRKFRKFIKELRKVYSGDRFQSMVKMTSNETVMNSEKSLMMWLNAHEFHKDKAKQEELDSLHKILPFESSKAIFVMLLFDKVKAIKILSEIVSVLLGEKTTFSCNLNNI